MTYTDQLTNYINSLESAIAALSNEDNVFADETYRLTDLLYKARIARDGVSGEGGSGGSGPTTIVGTTTSVISIDENIAAPSGGTTLLASTSGSRWLVGYSLVISGTGLFTLSIGSTEIEKVSGVNSIDKNLAYPLPAVDAISMTLSELSTTARLTGVLYLRS